MAGEIEKDDPMDIKEFTTHVAKKFCPWCGTPVTDSGKGRPRTFCSTRCRWAFDQYRYRKKKKQVEMRKEQSDGEQRSDA